MSQQAPHYPLLILDTSSRKTWVGLKLSADHLISKSEEQDPSKTLFKLVDAVLEQADEKLDQLSAIAFCAGPGSMLGARTASMAIRAWKGIGIPAARNVYCYNSLQIGSLIATRALEGSGMVLTDARRSSWNALAFPFSPDAALRLMANQDLDSAEGQLVTFNEFPSWTQTNATLTQLNYDPTPVFETEQFLSLLAPTDQASPLTIRSNEYKKWEAKIHSAPQA